MDKRLWKNKLITEIVAARNAGLSSEEITDIVASALRMARSLPEPENRPARDTPSHPDKED